MYASTHVHNNFQVQIPADKEAIIVSLILDNKAKQSNRGAASLRLSTKKLTVSRDFVTILTVLSSSVAF